MEKNNTASSRSVVAFMSGQNSPSSLIYKTGACHVQRVHTSLSAPLQYRMSCGLNNRFKAGRQQAGELERKPHAGWRDFGDSKSDHREQPNSMGPREGGTRWGHLCTFTGNLAQERTLKKRTLTAGPAQNDKDVSLEITVTMQDQTHSRGGGKWTWAGRFAGIGQIR